MPPILQTCISRFNAVRKLREELDEARSQLEDRKTIDRAKSIVMRLQGLSEDEAYALMRRTAMNEKQKRMETTGYSVKSAGSGPSHFAPREPAMLTQQRAPTRSASVRQARHFASAASRVATSGLSGLLQAPTSAITRSCSAAQRTKARTSASAASGASGQ